MFNTKHMTNSVLNCKVFFKVHYSSPAVCINPLIHLLRASNVKSYGTLEVGRGDKTVALA